MDLTLLKVLKNASSETFTRGAKHGFGYILNIFFNFMNREMDYFWSSHKTLKVYHPHDINQVRIPDVSLKLSIMSTVYFTKIYDRF